MATANTIVSRTGTGWTVDVSANNLDLSTALKDFIVLHAGTVASVGDYTKTTSTILTYNGSALGASTLVEVRRSTPVAQYQTLTGFPARLSSALWNKEIDRITRRAEEYALNGVGTNAVTTVALPKDDAFGVIWDSDIIYPPTRNAVYDYMVGLAPKADPVFTGNPTAPTAAYTDNDTTLATTKFVKDVLANSPAISSPALTGGTGTTVTAPDNTTNLATTAYVTALRNYYAYVIAEATLAQTPVTSGTAYYFGATGAVEHLDRAGNNASSVFTAPRTGKYRVLMTFSLNRGGSSTDGYIQLGYKINAGAFTLFATNQWFPVVQLLNVTFTVHAVVSMTAGQTLTLGFQSTHTGTINSADQKAQWEIEEIY